MAALVTLALGIPTSQDVDNVAVDSEADLLKAKQFLEKINNEHAQWSNKYTLADWDYASNLTSENLANKLNTSTEAAQYFKSAWKKVNEYPWSDIKDPNVRRQFKKFSVLGRSALPEDVTIQLLSSYSILTFKYTGSRKYLNARYTKLYDYRDHIGKIWNRSENVYRSYKTFIANIYLIQKLVYRVNNGLKDVISTKNYLIKFKLFKLILSLVIVAKICKDSFEILPI